MTPEQSKDLLHPLGSVYERSAHVDTPADCLPYASAVDFLRHHEASFVFAKTMPENPHWYLVRSNVRSDSEYVSFLRTIKAMGYDVDFGGRNYRCLDVAGHTYWHMQCDERVTIILNRKPIADKQPISWAKNPEPCKRFYCSRKEWFRCITVRGRGP